MVTSPRFPPLSSVDHTILQIVNVFKEAELPDTDLIHTIIKQAPSRPTEPKAILEGSQSGVKLSFATNRKPLGLPQVSAVANPRARRVIESGVQYYSNSLSDGSGFKKRIHGGDGDDETKPGGGYDRGCAAFLEFHEVSPFCMARTNISLKPWPICPAIPLVPVPRSLAIGLRYVAGIRGDLQ